MPLCLMVTSSLLGVGRKIRDISYRDDVDHTPFFPTNHPKPKTLQPRCDGKRKGISSERTQGLVNSRA